jgi:hypothetical protein
MYLDERQERILRRLAKEKGVSLTFLVRESVDLYLQKTPAEQDSAWRIIGLGKSRKPDLGSKHDDYLIAEINKESKRK